MVRRTTVLLDEEVYRKLVDASLRRYGTPKALSKVLNEELKDSISREKKVLRLVHSKKIARSSAAEFEKSRRSLSHRLEH